MTKIVLDAESFKALASDTRLQILKALDARPLTVSELSRLLDLNKATVFEHLKQLMAAELAKREDDQARKWVYYRLTWKGKNVLHPENAQIFLMLGLGALGLAGGIFQTAHLLGRRLSGAGDPVASSPDFEAAADASRSVNNASAPEAAASSTAPSGAQKDQAALQDPSAGAEPQPVAPAPEQGVWDAFTSTHVLTMVAIVVFLTLIALLVWALWQDQARERAKVRALIEKLPPDVNRAESVG